MATRYFIALSSLAVLTMTSALSWTLGPGWGVPAAAGTCAASTTCPTTTQFTVNAGALTINVPSGPINLGSGDAGTTISNTFTGAGGTVVTVSDQRAALSPSWTASVIAATGGFTTGGGTTAETIPNSDVAYTSGNATSTTGNGTFTPGSPTAQESLNVSRTAFSHSGGSGDNTAAWNPTITVDVPAQAVSGQYTGTINHSVA
jgi:hypothetical protein